MTLTDLPIWFVPSIPMMAFGLFVVPIVLLALVALAGWRFATVQPKPYTLYVFFGNVGLAGFVTCGPFFWDYSLQSLIIMSVTALSVVGEVIIRGLLCHLVTAASVVGVCICYYVILLSVVASATV